MRGVLGITAHAFADDISLTVFSSGDVVSASAINNNFSALATQIETLSTQVAALQGGGGGGGGGTPLIGVMALPESGAAGAVSRYCVLMQDNAIRCWGVNYNFGIDAATSADSAVAKPISGWEGIATSIGFSDDFGCILNDAGEVWCAGNNSEGQLGDGTTTSRATWAKVDVVEDVRDLALGYSQACAIVGEEGLVYCWGKNQLGVLGRDGDQSVPAAIDGLSGVVDVAMGGDSSNSHACAVLTGGGVKCWGSDGWGMLGNGDADGTGSTPVDVLDIANAVQVVGGAFHSCARLADNSVKCWGRGARLGDGTSEDRSSPVALASSVSASTLYAGSNHTCALLTSNGGITCWGSGWAGQLGVGNRNDSRSPITVPDLTDVAAVVPGSDQTCALLSDTTVKCWGSNRYGQLGNGVDGKEVSPYLTAVVE